MKTRILILSIALLGLNVAIFSQYIQYGATNSINDATYSGNLTIGTTSLSKNLTVNGVIISSAGFNLYGAGLNNSTNQRFAIASDYTNYKANYFDGAIGPDGNKMPFYFKWRGDQMSNSAMTILGNGYIGLGKTKPMAPLDVLGPIHFTGGSLSTLNAGQGCYLGWNQLTLGSGETDFINQQGIAPAGAGGFAFYNSSNTTLGDLLMLINGNGNVTFGTTTKSSLLTVNGDISAASLTSTGAISTGSLTITNKTFSGSTPTSFESISLGNGILKFNTTQGIAGTEYINFTEDISVLGGTFNTVLGQIGISGGDLYLSGANFKVSQGNLYARQVVVQTGTFPDYVFNKNYKLKSLKETDAYIKANGHLEDVPTATEVRDNGVNVGEMNVILLRKIEEITLLMIEQNKRIEALEKENSALKVKVEKFFKK